MNKFKKIMAGVLLAAGIGCVAGAVGCNKAPDYYTLKLEGVGIDYVFQGALAPEDSDSFLNGGIVKEGVEVRFTLSYGADTEGNAVILLNGEELIPVDGVYSFIMNKNSVITATGITQKQTVELSTGDLRIQYLDENGEELGENVKVSYGSDFKFKLWISPYYNDEYNVTVNTEELEADADGVYTIENVTADSTVNVNGLELADEFIARGEGSGTKNDPYIIRSAVDLYGMAAYVNSDYYLSFSTAYYELVEDIDMNGEMLFVIGDSSNSNAIFMGHFNGNGHTISNFYITDEVINQSTYEPEYLPYVGLFGTVVATTGGVAEIKNLTLKDYEVEVHPANLGTNQASYTGSLVGYGIGVEITNCNAEGGTITSHGNNNNMAYLGGIIGVMQSAYRETITSVITYDSFAYGCTTDVEITGVGTPRSAGGIVGYMTSADTSSIAYVSNCVSLGSVSGAMHSGGIVGSLGRFSSVNNCYASGVIYATNNISSASVNNSYKVAYAGGIVGYAENDTVISGCYSANVNVLAFAVGGASFQSTGDFVGSLENAGANSPDSALAITYNCLKKANGDTSSVFTEQLGWVESEWDLTSAQPKVSLTNTERNVSLKIMNGAEEVEIYQRSITVPTAVYAWYNLGDLPEYLTSESGRSWGYYFDADLTKKVPYGYIPSAASQTLYVGFADYGEVTGTYYIGATQLASGASVTLQADGVALFRNGGMNLSSVYSYDGQRVTIYNSCLGALLFTADQINGAYATVVLEKSANGYTIEGLIYITNYDDSTGSATYSQETISLTAQKEAANFVYGEYQDVNGSTIVFNKDGTAVYTYVGSLAQTINFTIGEDGKVTAGAYRVEVGGDGKVISFNNVAVQLKDNFKGVWQTDANSAHKYQFDGIDTVTYTDGVSDPVTATYTVTETGNTVGATFELNGNTVEAKFGADGFLYIDGVAHYLADGVTGTWYATVGSDEFEIQLGGVGLDGYGDAVITYFNGTSTSVNAQYDVSNGVVFLYVNDTLYGQLTYNGSVPSLSGIFYSLRQSINFGGDYYVTASFSRYDSFKGLWVTDMEGVATLTFSGKGAAKNGSTVLLTDENGKKTIGNYTLTDGNPASNTGTLTVGSVTYDIVLNDATGKVTLGVTDGEDKTLARRDDWYGITLYDEDGVSYTFGGNGYVGGTVTLSDKTTLAYTVGTDGSIEIEGEPLVVNGASYLWNGKTLSFKTGFAGRWLIENSNSAVIISEVSSSLTATFCLEGVSDSDMVFTYQPDKNVLVYTSSASNVESTITISLLGSCELGISVSASDDYFICIKDGMLDGWQGQYSAEDGSSWTFDGHGRGTYGKGSATYTDVKGNETIYKYTVNTIGQIYIRINGVYYVFAQTAEGGYRAAGAEVAYDMVTLDVMYLTEVNYDGVYYVLDGTGVMWRHDEGEYVRTTYTYTPLSVSTDVSLVVVTIDGVKKLGSIEKVGLNNILTLSDYAEWTLAGTNEKYVYDGNEILWLVGEDGYTRAYACETDSEDDTILYLTDAYGKEFILTLDKDNATITIEEDNNEA